MDETENGRGRLARIVLAVALAIVAIRSFRNGKRVTGVLAGVGAGAVGYSVTSEDRTLTKPVDVKTDSADDSVERTSEDIDIEGVSEDDSTEATVEDDTRRCAVCGDPIVPGQLRGPNADHEIVHKACMDADK